MTPVATGRDPSFTVSEFVAVFNQSIEMMYPLVSVTGELSNYRISKGKWVYFDLKDEYSSVRFFGSLYSLPGPLADGMVCEVFGRPRLHNQFGFSVNFDQIRPVGEGTIRKAQDLLLKKLTAEGLFSDERKRPLPYPPSRIGLVTSAESAAIADFQKIISARWPALKIELIDTLVQGTQAPAAIVQAIREFNLLSDPPEVLVLIRGGGSADDLAAFSEENVVRAVAASRLPTLVAIGHESDTSLAELAADMRASTPSNAAELLVPDGANEKLATATLRQEVLRLLTDKFNSEFLELRQIKNDQAEALSTIFTSHIHENARNRTLIHALNPMLPLEQGYALVRSETGEHIKRAAQMKGGNVFSLQFTDGKKHVQISENEQQFNTGKEMK